MKPTKRSRPTPTDPYSADEPVTSAYLSDAETTGPEAANPENLQFLAPPKNANELGWLAHYRVRKLLGQGGMGMVFLAEDTHLKRTVALKVIRPDVASASARKRFLREARTCAQVENDHIVTIYQVGEERDVPFMVMQFLKGTPLNDWLKRGKRMPLRDVLRIGKEMALGLAAAHEHGLIHRDIKPGNVWLESPSGRVKILDFGLARAVEQDAHEEITQTGNILGTLGYMAPEQADGQAVDGRADLFSLGCVLYEMASGQKPYQAKGMLAYLLALTTEVPRPVSDIDSSIPEEFSNLIAKLLSRDPDDRLDSAEEVADAIAAIEDDLSFKPRTTASEDSMLFGDLHDDTEPNASTRTAERKPPASRKMLIAIGGGAIFLLVAVVVAYYGLRKKDDPASSPSEVVKEDPKAKDPPKKSRLDRPIDERERDQIKAQSIDRQVSLISDDLTRWNRGFNPKRENAMKAETFGTKAIKLIEIETGALDDLTPLRALPELSQIVIRGSSKPIKLKGLAGLPLTLLSCQKAEIDLDDLGAIVTLKHLDLSGTTVKNLWAVSRFAVDTLNLSGAGLERIEALKSVPTLRKLELANNPVADLSPLRGLPMEYLDITDCKNVVDIAVLSDLPLTELRCTYQPAFKSLKEHKTLKQINLKSRDEFFKE